MLDAIILSVIMLSVIMLNVIMLSVEAPEIRDWAYRYHDNQTNILSLPWANPTKRFCFKFFQSFLIPFPFHKWGMRLPSELKQFRLQ